MTKKDIKALVVLVKVDEKVLSRKEFARRFGFEIPTQKDKNK